MRTGRVPIGRAAGPLPFAAVAVAILMAAGLTGPRTAFAADDVGVYTPLNAASGKSANGTSSVAPAVTPAAGIAAGPVKTEISKSLIRRNAPADGENAPSAPRAGQGTGYDIIHVAFMLMLVIGLIVLIGWGTRKLSKTPLVTRSKAVQVLTRTAMSPKQHVVLLQVGKRLIVVAEGATQVTTLDQITDPDEVASLIGQVRAEKQAIAIKPFGSFFRRAKNMFQGETAEQGDPKIDAEYAAHFGPTSADGVSDVDRDEIGDALRSARQETAETDDDDVRNVAAAQVELGGLMAKVRHLSRQFGRG